MFVCMLTRTFVSAFQDYNTVAYHVSLVTEEHFHRMSVGMVKEKEMVMEMVMDTNLAQILPVCLLHVDNVLVCYNN